MRETGPSCRAAHGAPHWRCRGGAPSNVSPGAGACHSRRTNLRQGEQRFHRQPPGLSSARRRPSRLRTPAAGRIDNERQGHAAREHRPRYGRSGHAPAGRQRANPATACPSGSPACECPIPPATRSAPSGLKTARRCQASARRPRDASGSPPPPGCGRCRPAPPAGRVPPETSAWDGAMVDGGEHQAAHPRIRPRGTPARSRPARVQASQSSDSRARSLTPCLLAETGRGPPWRQQRHLRLARRQLGDAGGDIAPEQPTTSQDPAGASAASAPRGVGHWCRGARLARMAAIERCPQQHIAPRRRAAGPRQSPVQAGRTVSTSFIEWTAASIRPSTKPPIQLARPQRLAADLRQGAVLHLVAAGDHRAPVPPLASRPAMCRAQPRRALRSACAIASGRAAGAKAQERGASGSWVGIGRRLALACALWVKGKRAWMCVLGIESSCDETAAALVRAGPRRSSPTGHRLARTRRTRPMAAWCRRSPRAPMPSGWPR